VRPSSRELRIRLSDDFTELRIDFTDWWTDDFTDWLTDDFTE
jgi:hypothetical protein